MKVSHMSHDVFETNGIVYKNKLQKLKTNSSIQTTTTTANSIMDFLSRENYNYSLLAGE